MRRLWSRWRGALSRATGERTSVAASSAVADAPVDDEERAAFLDGRLSDDDRAKMMAQVAENADTYDIFACAAAMLAESGDALFEQMQTAEVRAAADRSFDASPADLRKAAIEAARSSAG